MNTITFITILLKLTIAFQFYIYIPANKISKTGTEYLCKKCQF